MSETTVPTIPFADLPQETGSLSGAYLIAVINNTDVKKAPYSSFQDGFVTFTDDTSSAPVGHALTWTDNGILAYNGSQWRKAPFYGAEWGDLTDSTRFLLVNTGSQSLTEGERQNAMQNLGLGQATETKEGLVRLAEDAQDYEGVVTAAQMVNYVTNSTSTTVRFEVLASESELPSLHPAGVIYLTPNTDGSYTQWAWSTLLRRYVNVGTSAITETTVVTTVTDNEDERTVPTAKAVYDFVRNTSNTYTHKQTFTDEVEAHCVTLTGAYAAIPAHAGLWKNLLALEGDAASITFVGPAASHKLTYSGGALRIDGEAIDTVSARDAAVEAVVVDAIEEAKGYADAKVVDGISSTDRTHAPSGAAVYSYIQQHGGGGGAGGAAIVYTNMLPQTGSSDTVYVSKNAPSSYTGADSWIYSSGGWVRAGQGLPKDTVYSGDTKSAPSSSAVYSFVTELLSGTGTDSLVRREDMMDYAVAKTDLVSYAGYSSEPSRTDKAITPAALTGALTDFVYQKDFDRDLEVTGKLTVGGGLTAQSNAEVYGALSVYSDVTFSGSVTVSADAGKMSAYSGSFSYLEARERLTVDGRPLQPTVEDMSPYATVSGVSSSYSVLGVVNERWVKLTGNNGGSIIVDLTYSGAASAAAVQYLTLEYARTAGAKITVNYKGKGETQTHVAEFEAKYSGDPNVIQCIQDPNGRISVLSVSNVKSGDGSPYSTLQVFNAGVELYSNVKIKIAGASPASDILVAEYSSAGIDVHKAASYLAPAYYKSDVTFSGSSPALFNSQTRFSGNEYHRGKVYFGASASWGESGAAYFSGNTLFGATFSGPYLYNAVFYETTTFNGTVDTAELKFSNAVCQGATYSTRFSNGILYADRVQVNDYLNVNNGNLEVYGGHLYLTNSGMTFSGSGAPIIEGDRLWLYAYGTDATKQYQFPNHRGVCVNQQAVQIGRPWDSASSDWLTDGRITTTGYDVEIGWRESGNLSGEWRGITITKPNFTHADAELSGTLLSSAKTLYTQTTKYLTLDSGSAGHVDIVAEAFELQPEFVVVSPPPGVLGVTSVTINVAADVARTATGNGVGRRLVVTYNNTGVTTFKINSHAVPSVGTGLWWSWTTTVSGGTKIPTVFEFVSVPGVGYVLVATSVDYSVTVTA